MDNPQYKNLSTGSFMLNVCFKPYYKWITLNTKRVSMAYWDSGISFKPYYKWITLNTLYFKINLKRS